MTYEVVKYYQDDRNTEVIRTGLDLKTARQMCNDPETSSMTARKPQGCDQDEKQIQRWHDKQKLWFYGYRSEA